MISDIYINIVLSVKFSRHACIMGMSAQGRQHLQPELDVSSVNISALQEPSWSPLDHQLARLGKKHQATIVTQTSLLAQAYVCMK